MSRDSAADGRVGLIAATIDRPECVQRLIKSARKHLGDIPIYIADQSEKLAAQEGFYQDNNVTVIWMEHDSGVSKSRNALLEVANEDYLLLCDDDFIITENTILSRVIELMDAEHDIGVVGGALDDVYYDFNTHTEKGWHRNWELFFHFDQQKGLLTAIPGNHFAPTPKVACGIAYHLYDAVMNFALFRNSMFSDGIRWDPRFKSNGEHEDFYLSLKCHGKWKVAYTSSFKAKHHHPKVCEQYSNLRFRQQGWRDFLDKWGIEQYLELGQGLRIIGRHSEVAPSPLDWQITESAGYLETSLVEEAGLSVLPNGNLLQVGDRRRRAPSRFANISQSTDSESVVRLQESHYREDKLANTASSQDLDDFGTFELAIKHPINIISGQRFTVFARSTNHAELEDVGLQYTYIVDGKEVVYRHVEKLYDQIHAPETWNAYSLQAPCISGTLQVQACLSTKRADNPDKVSNFYCYCSDQANADSVDCQDYFYALTTLSSDELVVSRERLAEDTRQSAESVVARFYQAYVGQLSAIELDIDAVYPLGGWMDIDVYAKYGVCIEPLYSGRAFAEDGSKVKILFPNEGGVNEEALQVSLNRTLCRLIPGERSTPVQR